ncbi:MAG: hypothetical protein WBE98_08120, partial [Gammaproteobacteria bacterium]
EPDIRAKLDMMQASRVPLERCSGYSYRFNAPPCDMSKAWLTEEEYNEALRRWSSNVDVSRQALQEGNIALSLRTGLVDPNVPQRQTNLIVDPPNGLLPALTPEGKRLALQMGSDWALPGEDLTFDGPEDFDNWDRCITRGLPSSMMPYRYNGGFFIEQAPGYVIFRLEMIHEARIIPTTDVEELPPEIKQYLGHSRGRWEGTTLVVETTNFKATNPLLNLAVVGAPPGNRFPSSEQLKVTERVVRLNDDTWLYEITAEDPVILTAPFTVRYPMRHNPDYLMPEYACHEGNTIVRYYTETSRYERANPTPEPEQAPVAVSADVAKALNGRWVGRPRIVTVDLDIELEFTDNGDNTVNAKLIGTTLGEINKPLRDLTIDGRVVRFTLPNIDPWRFQGELTADGTLQGIVASAQGSLPVTFRPLKRK